eukprot:SAG11_NODE_30174_length_303_cov_1.014706_1_plen_100_part_11
MWLSLNRHHPVSPWGPYLRAMPTVFDLPFLWPAAVRAELLQPALPALAARVEADLAMVNSTHAKYMAPFCARLPAGAEMCSMSSWKWAWAVAWSRAMAVP